MKKILYAGSEIMPFAATGGLGDVLGSLPAALKRCEPDCDVRAVMPLYAQVGAAWREKMTFVKCFTVKLAWREQYCGVFSLEKDGVLFYFIDNEYYFKRGALYGEFDDGERFAFFSLAVLELMREVDFYPEVFHANDWQTALSVIQLKQKYQYGAYTDIRAVYTIHNIEYQGVYGKLTRGDLFALDAEQEGIVEYHDCINLTKGAIVCADFVTTVSPNYAKEIRTPEYSSGLHPILNEYADKLDGVINGIDFTYYDPHTDPEIPFHYSWRGQVGKRKNKKAMQERFGLEVRPDVPVIAMISRLASHKGFDLVTYILDEIMQDDVQFILLGTGEAGFEAFFREAAGRYPGRISINLTYDRTLSKLIYAGADLFLMPSRSEACGLSQMIASRYGAVPIVRETGGLYDTIKPYAGGEGNGFTFASYNAHEMLHAIREAEWLYRDTERWNALVKKVMRVDFSWNASAKTYDALYQRLLNS